MKHALIVSIALSFIFLYSAIFHFGIPIELAHGDSFHAMLTIKHLLDIITKGDWGNILQMPIFYGFKDSYLYSELFIFESLSALPFYFLSGNIIFSYNVASVLAITMSSFTMFLYAKYMTNKFWPSVLASIIFVFNPFTIGHFPDNIHYYSLQWLPLIFLYTEKFLKDKGNKNAFLLFLFLTMQSLTALTFGALLVIILPIYGILRSFQLKLIKKPQDIKKYINIGAIVGIILFAGVNLNIDRAYSIYFAGKPVAGDLQSTKIFAPWISDLFLVSPNNLLYGWTRPWASQNLQGVIFQTSEYIERNLFFGITVWALLILSFLIIRKSKQKGIWVTSILISFFCLLVSFGPEIRFTDNFAIPGIYNIFYTLDPLLQNLRVSSRFMFVGYLFIALICAEVASKKSNLFVYIAIVFVIVEYSNIPWKYNAIPQSTQDFYTLLDKNKDIKVILELPMGNLFSPISMAKNQFVDSEYLLYAASLHNKYLLNGYSSYTPVKYPARIEYLTVFFPTPSKLDQLKKWGVDAIILHKDGFEDINNYYNIEASLKGLGVKEIYQKDGLDLFKLD